MKNFYETILASGGFAGESFDVAVGPANTDVIDILLSVGDGALTGNAPINISSTGLLGGDRNLDITALENADGRLLIFSIRNSDIATNNITINVTNDINGGGNLLTITEETDYLFVHESIGFWRAYIFSITGASSTSDQFMPHCIIDGETITVPDCRQMIVFGGLELEGTGALNLIGDAELVLKL